MNEKMVKTGSGCGCLALGTIFCFVNAIIIAFIIYFFGGVSTNDEAKLAIFIFVVLEIIFLVKFPRIMEWVRKEKK